MTRVGSQSRLIGIDLARCVALIGMIATHALVTETPDGGVTAVQAIAGGRASALFAVLAGVSLALMTGSSVPLTGRPLRAARAGLVVRALAVAVLGLLLGGLPTTVAVILTYYGVLFCLGLPFLRLRAVPLAALAVCWAALGPVLSHLVRPLLPERGFASPSPASLADPVVLGCELLWTGYYPAVPWLAYLLLGMALGRIDLRPARAAGALLGAGAGTAVLASAASGWLLARDPVRAELVRTLPGSGDSPAALGDALAHGLSGTTPTGSWWWLAVDAPHSGTPFDLMHTGGSAVAVVGACLLVARAAPRLLGVVSGAGAMTLTLYSLHVVMRTPALLPDDDVATFTHHVVLVLAVGAGYRLAGRRGPLERLVAAVAGVGGEAATRPAPPAAVASGQRDEPGQH